MDYRIYHVSFSPIVQVLVVENDTSRRIQPYLKYNTIQYSAEEEEKQSSGEGRRKENETNKRERERVRYNTIHTAGWTSFTNLTTPLYST